MFALRDLKDDADARSVDSCGDASVKRDYTEEEAMGLIDELCVGYTTEQAAKCVDQMIGKIRNHVLELDASTPEGIVGRNVHEYITHSLKLAGESVISCVRSNLSLERILCNLRTSRSLIDTELHDIEKSCIAPTEPNKTYLKSKYRVQLADEIASLEAIFTKMFHEAKPRIAVEIKREVEDMNIDNDISVLRKGKRASKKSAKRAEKEYDKSKGAELGPDELSHVDEEVERGNWLRSPEYRKFQEGVTVASRRIDLEFDREYVQTLRDYEHQKSTHYKMQLKIKGLKDQLKDHTVSEIFINGLQSIMVNIATTVSNVVRRYPGIRSKLEGQIILLNGERMVDPLGKMSLSGIYSILYRDYSKASLDVFCTMLLQLMSEDQGYEASVNSPELGVQKVLQQLRAWEQLELYTYMSKDKLFTVALLKSYHPKSDVRIRGVTIVIEFVRRLELGDMTGTTGGDHSDMPIFMHLIDWIERVHGASKKFGKGDTSTSVKTANTGNDKKFSGATSSWNPKKTGGYEQAAAASVTPETGQDAVGPYTNAVGREPLLQVTLTDGAGAGRRVPYTATQHQCSACYVSGTQEKKKNGNHIPYCYSGQCRKCNMFGHRNSQCLQVLSKEQTAKQG